MKRRIFRTILSVLLGLVLLSLEAAHCRADADAVVNDFQKKQNDVLNSRMKRNNQSGNKTAAVPSSAQKPATVSQNRQNQRLYISHDGVLSVFDLTNFEPVTNIKSDDVFANSMVRQGNNVYFMDALSVTTKKVDDLSTINSIDFENMSVPRNSRIRVTLDGKKIYMGEIGWGKADISGVIVIDLINSKQVEYFKRKS